MTTDSLEAAQVKIYPPRPGAQVQVPLGLAQFKLPWLTFAILVVLVAVFVMENLFAVTPGTKSGPSIATLFAMGGLSGKAIMTGGQWYRLFTAPLLHASFPHILGNCIALVVGGLVLERLVGRLWFFALFVVSALGGALVSLVVTPPNVIAVGASGAIMGLFSALLVTSFRLPAGTAERKQLQVYSLRMLIPALLPLFASKSGVHVDYGAHFGGALSGAILAALFLTRWSNTDRIPQLRAAATSIAIVGAVLFAASAGITVYNFPQSDVALVPPAKLPAQNNTVTDGRAAYLRDYKPASGEPLPPLGKCATLFRTGPGAVPGINCAK